MRAPGAEARGELGHSINVQGVDDVGTITVSSVAAAGPEIKLFSWAARMRDPDSVARIRALRSPAGRFLGPHGAAGDLARAAGIDARDDVGCRDRCAGQAASMGLKGELPASTPALPLQVSVSLVLGSKVMSFAGAGVARHRRAGGVGAGVDDVGTTTEPPQVGPPLKHCAMV